MMDKVSFEAVALWWLICTTHGRLIATSEPSKVLEFGSGGSNGNSGVQNGRWFDDSDGKIKARESRLSKLEWSAYSVREPNGPGTFAFGYDNAVDSAGNEHYRTEERFSDGTVVGEYGYTDYGINRIVHVSYTADHRGYRAKTEYLPLAGSSLKRMPGLSLPL